MSKILNTLLGGIAILLVTASCSSGTIKTPDDTKYLSDFNTAYFEQAPVKPEQLALYVDYSTCMALAQNSAFFKAITPSLVSMSKDYYAIQGNDINKMSGNTYALLKTIEEKDYANLPKAALQIAEGNKEAILMTDGEFYEKSALKSHVNDPYLLDAFRQWLVKGHDIHFLIEPYKEPYRGKVYDKKRFYIIFTDDRMKNNCYEKITSSVNIKAYPEVQEFHLSACHPVLDFEENGLFETNENLTCSSQSFGAYEVQDWDTSWSTIKKLSEGEDGDASGLPEETLMEGLKVEPDMGLFKIKKLSLKVYDINQAYADFYNGKEAGQPVQATEALNEIPQFMLLDDKKFSSDNEVKLYFDPSFNDSYFVGKPYNYFKVALYIGDYEPQSSRLDALFDFESIDMQGQTNISVAESIRQCLTASDVKDAVKKEPVYSVYVKSNKY